MRREGRAEWVGKGGENSAECWIWWRTPEEWASGIYEWVSEWDMWGEGGRKGIE